MTLGYKEDIEQRIQNIEKSKHDATACEDSKYEEGESCQSTSKLKLVYDDESDSFKEEIETSPIKSHDDNELSDIEHDENYSFNEAKEPSPTKSCKRRK